MAATICLLRASVGVKGVNSARDVQYLQDLMIAAGVAVKGGADGKWGEATRLAIGEAAKGMPSGVKAASDIVRSDDYLPLYLAWKANILIPMPGKAGMPGVFAMHEWFVRQRTRYNAGAEKGQGDRAIWGLQDDLRYAVQTTGGRLKAGPVEMDCTTYVNLMLSIFAAGHCHNEPYAANCAKFGGTSAAHCARDRFSMPLVARKSTGTTNEVRYFKMADEIKEAVGLQASKLFALEVATAGTGGVTHMALLHDGTVYECTTGQAGSACISRSLDEFCSSKKDKIYYLFGPNLATR